MNINVNYLQEKCEIELKAPGAISQAGNFGSTAGFRHVANSGGTAAATSQVGISSGSTAVPSHVGSNGGSTAGIRHMGSSSGSTAVLPSREPVRQDLSVYTVSTQLSEASTHEKQSRVGK